MSIHFRPFDSGGANFTWCQYVLPLSLFRVLHFSGFLVIDSACSVVHYLVFPFRRDLFAASEFTLFWGQPFAVSQTAPTALQRVKRCSKYFLFLLRSV